MFYFTCLLIYRELAQEKFMVNILIWKETSLTVKGQDSSPIAKTKDGHEPGKWRYISVCGVSRGSPVAESVWIHEVHDVVE